MENLRLVGMVDLIRMEESIVGKWLGSWNCGMGFKGVGVEVFVRLMNVCCC